MENEAFLISLRAASSDAPPPKPTLAASSDAPPTNITKAASSNAPNTTTPRVASQDAPKRPPPKAASQDAPKRQAPKAASSDAPRHEHKHTSAASKGGKRKATVRNAPNQAASLTASTSFTTKDAPTHKTNTTPTTRLRTDLALGDSRKIATQDAPKQAASTAAVSERDQTNLTEAPRSGSPNTTGIDMSSLRDAIQSPVKQEHWTTVSRKKTSSKQSSLKALAKAAPRNVVLDCPAAVPETTPVPAGADDTAIKRKRSMKPRGRKKQPNKTPKTDGEPPARAQKRMRPEDSVTPTGVGKKSKPARSHMVGGSSVSYAEAAAAYKNNELCVAVMTEPFEDMTQEQAEVIRQQIESRLRELLMTDPEPANPTVNTDIHFRGRAHFAEGVLKTWCEDAFTLAWLKGIISNMASPIPGTSLTVRPQADIPKKALCMLFVPENTGETQALLKMLSRQNSNLNINKWTLTHERVRQDPPGTCLYFRVPESMVSAIKNQDRRVYYLMGSIYIRFLEEDAPREVAAVPATTTTQTSIAPGPEHDPPRPASLLSPPAMVMDAVAEERVPSTAAMEAELAETQDPSSPGLTTDEECFRSGEEREGDDSSICSSPLRDN